MNTDQTIFTIAAVPAIIGLVQVCKDIGLPTRAAPAVAVLFGILAALAQFFAGRWPWIPTVVIGIALGLSACGLYAGIKTVTGQPGPVNLLESMTQVAAPATPTTKPADTPSASPQPTPIRTNEPTTQ